MGVSHPYLTTAQLGGAVGLPVLFDCMARSTGIEPVAFGFGNQRSIQLSYERMFGNKLEHTDVKQLFS